MKKFNIINKLQKQQGAVLLLMVVILVVGAMAMLVNSLSATSLQLRRDKVTADALAQAKDALIGYAVSVTLSKVDPDRPGDLPCPDTDNTGTADAPCSGNALGRFPWRTLGLPDLRDGSGERLWYAVSTNFKNSPRSTCTNADLSGCLNSDTAGTITVFAADGSTPLMDGGSGTGAVAIIIAPGDVVQRAGSPQDRSATGSNSASNYLDIVTIGANTIDNAAFIDSSSSNGFIQGTIKDSSGQISVNDHLLAIIPSQIMPLLEKRVVTEVTNCLIEYAAISQNNHYYPWATSRSTAGSLIVYNDSDQLKFGHIPDPPFIQTCIDTGGINCNSSQSGGMWNSWGPTCKLAKDKWWVNWKEVVFYGIAHSLRPHNLSHNHTCPGSTCIEVNPPSTAVDKSVVVIAAGKKINMQARSTNTDKNNFANYLEGQNGDGITPYEQNLPTASFNDIVVFQ